MRQTCDDWECIVVDDGSDQPIDDVIEAANDSRIRLVKHDTNKGRGAARNTGVATAKGNIIAWQDADDWSVSRRFDEQLKALQRWPSACFVGAGMLIVDQQYECVGVRADQELEPQFLTSFQPPKIGHATLMFQRKVLDTVAYRQHIKTAEDYDFLVRALAQYKFTNLSTPLYCYQEYQSKSLGKRWSSTWTHLMVAREKALQSPLQASSHAIFHVGKAVAHTIVRTLGGPHELIARKPRTPTDEEIANYKHERNELHQFVLEHFNGLALL